jgi:hypothetical protein
MKKGLVWVKSERRFEDGVACAEDSLDSMVRPQEAPQHGPVSIFGWWRCQWQCPPWSGRQVGGTKHACLAVGRGICAEHKMAARVDIVHARGFDHPVGCGVLENAEGVDPQVPKAKSLGHGDGITKGCRQDMPWNAQRRHARFQVFGRGCDARGKGLAPAVAQRKVGLRSNAGGDVQDILSIDDLDVKKPCGHEWGGSGSTRVILDAVLEFLSCKGKLLSRFGTVLLASGEK